MDLLAVIAPMAAQPTIASVVAVDREGNIAVGAHHHLKSLADWLFKPDQYLNSELAEEVYCIVPISTLVHFST